MDITFDCPYCDAEIQADTTQPDGRATCPGCHEVVLIPAAGIKPGMTLGDFRIERCLGVGGMGEVFLATQLAMDRPVALKVLPPAVTGNKALVDRFLQEARMAGKLEHPNVVTAFYAGQDAGYYYLAMSYVEGEDLESRIKNRGRLPESDALKICLNVGKALDYAWKKHHLLHRDIKPANIMIAKDGEVKLMDMGIAKAMTEDSGLTMAGVMLGTPFYMSPEQAKNIGELDCRTDIYALGGTLFHLVTGRRPFDGPTAISVVAKHLNDPVPIASAVCTEVSPECGQLIGRMMAKEPDHRPADWGEMVRLLEDTLDFKNPSTLELKVTESQQEILAGQRQRPNQAVAQGDATIGVKGTVGGVTEEEPAMQQPRAPQVASPGGGMSPNATMSDYVQSLPANPPVPRSLKIGLGVIVILIISLIGVWVWKAALDVSREREKQRLEDELARSKAALQEKQAVGSIEEGLAFHQARAEHEVRERTRLKQLEEMVNLARQFDDEHPDQIRRSIEKFTKIKQQAEGTKYALLVDDDLANLRYRQERVQILRQAVQGSWFTPRGSQPRVLITLTKEGTFRVTLDGKNGAGTFRLSPDTLHLYHNGELRFTWPIEMRDNGTMRLTVQGQDVTLRKS